MNGKRLLSALLAVLALIAPIAAAACESCTRTQHVVNCEYWVSLRKAPNENSERIMKIPLRAMVYRADDKTMEDDFVYVRYAGYTGYVQAQYLSRTDPETGEAFATPMYVANCREYITLREIPQKGAAALAKLPLGAAVECLNDPDNPNPESDWAYVAYTNPATGERMTGSVLRKYLCLLPAGDCLESAAMNVSLRGDETRQQVITDRQTLQAIAEIIRTAAPNETGKCPLGAQLVLVLKDGSRQYFSYPTDGCPNFRTENGEAFGLPEEERQRINAIFAEAFAGIE